MPRPRVRLAVTAARGLLALASPALAVGIGPGGTLTIADDGSPAGGHAVLRIKKGT